MPQSWSGAQHAFYPHSSWPGSMANLQSNTSHANEDKGRVRTVARKLIASAPTRLADIEHEWFKELSAYD